MRLMDIIYRPSGKGHYIDTRYNLNRMAQDFAEAGTYNTPVYSRNLITNQPNSAGNWVQLSSLFFYRKIVL